MTERNLLTEYPKVCKEWDYRKNDYGPEHYAPKSNSDVYWKCKKNRKHRWKAKINNRVIRNDRCPYCSNKKICEDNCLKTLRPDICKYWDYDKNEKKPTEVGVNSHSIIHWKCTEGYCDCHEWTKLVYAQVRNNCCPYCKKTKVCKHNNLLAMFPNICEEWNYDKNDINPSKVVYSSSKPVYWICKINPCGCHRWRTTINTRTGKTKSGCPYCKNRKICDHNSLYAKFKDMIDNEWDYEKNNKYDPKKIAPGKAIRVHWVCRKNTCGCHRWFTKLDQRTCGSRTGCPYCSGKKICPHNSLQSLFPEIAKEFDVERNGITPDKISPGTSKPYYWKCEKMCKNCHKWKMIVYSRTGKYKIGCPYCNKHKVCPHNSLYTLHKELVDNEWDFEKNKQYDPTKILPNKEIMIHWICSKNRNHKWKARLNCRTRTNRAPNGCPHCNCRSHGEDKVIGYLKKLGIKYKKQVKFKKCKHKSYLFFDFYLVDYEALIEYDGEQHFRANDLMGGEKTFKQRLIRDAIKNKFCANNGLPLLRISYKQYNKINDLIEYFIKHIDDIENQKVCIMYSDDKLYGAMKKS